MAHAEIVRLTAHPAQHLLVSAPNVLQQQWFSLLAEPAVVFQLKLL